MPAIEQAILELFAKPPPVHCPHCTALVIYSLKIQSAEVVLGWGSHLPRPTGRCGSIDHTPSTLRDTTSIISMLENLGFVSPVAMSPRQQVSRTSRDQRFRFVVVFIRTIV
jgi:hypothetical protein